MGVGVRIIGLTRLRTSFRRYRDTRESQLEDSVFKFAFGTEIYAKRNVPIKTGDLQKSIRYLPKGRSLVKKISANMDYADIVEKTHKTRAHYLERAFIDNKSLFLTDIRRLFRKAT